MSNPETQSSPASEARSTRVARRQARPEPRRNEKLVLLTVEEVALLLSKTRKAIYTMVERGQFPANVIVRIGRGVRFDEERLIGWLRSEACAPSQMGRRA